MRSLPILELPLSPRRKARASAGVHALRIAVVALALIGLHRRQAAGPVASDSAIDRAVIAAAVPAAAEAVPQADPSLVKLLLADGTPLGFALQTSPAGDSVIGYAGPSNVLIVTDESGSLTDVHLIRCPDTVEHLRKVQSNAAFWRQFEGWRLGETADVRVDGVSGATLTSLAIGEAIALRMSIVSSSAGEPGTASEDTAAARPAARVRRSSRFPDPPDAEKLHRWFPDAAETVEEAGSPWRVRVLAANGDELGSIIRTGPLHDSTIGYQGPSELILRIDEDGRVADLMPAHSYDNQPYLRYVEQERSFWKKFKERDFESLAELDLDAEEIDGVSGATMTSIAVAETLRDAAAVYLEITAAAEEVPQVEERATFARGQSPVRRPRWNTSYKEWLTGGIAVAAIFWSRSHRRGRKGWRRGWQAACLVVLGLVCGNLLSVALISGWIHGGVPLRLAPGLTLLALTAVALAALRKSNVYCDHLCPHGIVQQWIRPKRGRRLPAWFRHTLAVSAIAIILLTIAGPLFPWRIDLARLEPFDTYAWRVGVSLSLAIWCVSLLLARFDPMAYCRYACPTGKLLGYVRRSGQSSRVTLADAAAVIFAAAVWWA